MDAFSVSIANGLSGREMDFARVSAIAGTFAVFQFIMPMTGWIMVHTAAEKLTWFEKWIPWIALVLLGYIGSKMIIGGLRERNEGIKSKGSELGFATLMMQGVATSIDALSVGFTTSSYGTSEAIISAAIIGSVTFLICAAGCRIGSKAGVALSWKAPILGGVILIVIAVRMIITSDILTIIT